MDESKQALVSTIASKVTYGGAGTSVVSYLASSEFGIVAGIVVGVLGLLVNWYYKAKQDRRDEREHQRRMAADTVYQRMHEQAKK